MQSVPPTKIEQRIKILARFHDNLIAWFNLSVDFQQEEAQFAHTGAPESIGQRAEELRRLCNRDLIPVRSFLAEAGVIPVATLHGQAPVDLLANVWESVYGNSPIPAIADMTDQAIGYYEHILAGGDPVVQAVASTAQSIDVVEAILRALRPAFKKDLPNGEKAVQDAVEIILHATGVAFTREKERVTIAGKSTIPDFVLTTLDCALEIKFAKPGNDWGNIQGEILEDISAYGTRWKRQIFIIYDCGVIVDGYVVERELAQTFGVTVRVVKH